MAKSGPSAKLCQRAVNTKHQDLPPDVRKETLTILSDQVACMIAAATLPSCQPVVDLVRKLGGNGECSIVGHPLRTTATYAALANGTIAHGDECNSTGQHGTGQFACVVVPAALSVGQYVGASGTEFCRAIALGSEVGGRFVNLLGKHRTRPQFAAATGLTMGGAICAGTLLGLNAEQLENALGLAAASACGLNSYHDEETHQTKSFAAGKAAEAGTLAALLAREGFHGPHEPLTVENGYCDAFLGLPEAGEEIVEALGDVYMMREIAYKRFPVGGPDQTPLYALLQIMREEKLTADDMKEIEVSLSANSHHTVTVNRHPAIHIETVLSLGAFYGEVTFPHVYQTKYHEDPRFKAFRERLRFKIVPRPGRATSAQRLETEVTVRTVSGKAITRQLRFPVMTEDEVRKKFYDLAGLRLNSNQVKDLERKLNGIEAEKNVTALIGELEIPYS